MNYLHFMGIAFLVGACFTKDTGILVLAAMFTIQGDIKQLHKEIKK